MPRRVRKTNIVYPDLGSFASSAAPRFTGSHNYEIVIQFLQDINEYKTKNHVSDAYAVTNIPLLLERDALDWWNEVKAEICTWHDFETRLRAHFAPVKPNYVLYQELMTKKKSHLPLDALIEHKMHLFSELPEHHEKVKLDMIYASIMLQEYPIEEKIPRETVNTCDEFLRAARNLLRREASGLNGDGDSASAQLGKNGKVRCSFCRFHGHSKEQCKKWKKKLEAQESMKPSTSGATGGASTGAIKKGSTAGTNSGSSSSKSKKCSKDKNDFKHSNEGIDPQSIPLTFFTFPREKKEVGRPVVFIEIDEVREVGLLKTGAGASFLSLRMYQHLLAKGIKFEECYEEIFFALGPAGHQHMYRAELNVKLEGFDIPTIFYVWKDWVQYNTWTYLGMAFMEKARMAMILSKMKRVWYVSGERQKEYKIYDEYDAIVTCAIEAYKVETEKFLKQKESPDSPRDSSPETIDIHAGAPMIFIEIEGVRDMGLLKTGADYSILSSRMYKHLVAKGIKFEECYEEIHFTFGPEGPQHMYKAVLNVTLEGKYVIPSQFYVWIGFENPITFLGFIFLFRDAKMGLEISNERSIWNFRERKNEIFEVHNEGDPIVTSAMEEYKAETERFLKKVARTKQPRFVGKGRPVVFVEIEGVEEIAFLKSGVDYSILSNRMYDHLVAKGIKFQECYEEMHIALGPSGPKHMYKADLIVNLEEQVILAKFYVWKEIDNPITCLGSKFIRHGAKMVMSFERPCHWHVSGREHEKFDMYQEDDPLVISAMETYKKETENFLKLAPKDNKKKSGKDSKGL